LSRRRVVITGLGIVSPVGNSVAEAWANVLAGKSGITKISRFDPSRLACQIAGEVKGLDLAQYLERKEARHMDTFIHFGMAAGIQALRDCGIQVTPENAERIGVNIGSGIGGLPMIEQTQRELLAGGPRKISPYFIPSTIINMISGNLSIKYGLKGPNLAMVTACTTATHCIGESGRLIEYGDCDVMVAGGAEAVVTELAMGGFAQARALSTRNDDPATASRPWDRDRDGFVLGEGAGVLVLEEYEHAKARGAKIYAELAGYGMSGDAFHMTAPREDGEGAARCMKCAAELTPERRPGGLHQCPWHLDALGRSRRNHCGEAQPGRARKKSCAQFDQIHDRAPAGRGRRRGGRVFGTGGAPPGGATHDQYVQPGSSYATWTMYRIPRAR